MVALIHTDYYLICVICSFFFLLWRQLTREVFQALAGVTSLSAAASPVVHAGPRVAEIDLGLAVVPGETERTAAAQPVDGVDGPKQNRVGGDEGRGAVELQHRHALHVVLTGLPQADVVVKRQHLERETSVISSCNTSVFISEP